jgi:hypothetical protein
VRQVEEPSAIHVGKIQIFDDVDGDYGVKTTNQTTINSINKQFDDDGSIHVIRSEVSIWPGLRDKRWREKGACSR